MNEWIMVQFIKNPRDESGSINISVVQKIVGQVKQTWVNLAALSVLEHSGHRLGVGKCIHKSDLHSESLKYRYFYEKKCKISKITDKIECRLPSFTGNPSGSLESMN